MSPSQMNTQRTATARNSRAETTVQALLTIFGEELLSSGHLASRPVIESQVRWQTELCSDVWDHRFTGVTTDGDEWVIWAQTTNYKGHTNRKAESNKTYEVRETLTEALTLRATWPTKGNNRSVHFTIGPTDYAYGWFSPMKSCSFDRSITISTREGDIFAQIDALLTSTRTESQVLGKIRDEVASKSALGIALKRAIDELHQWWLSEGLSTNPIADAQAHLIRAAIPARTTVQEIIETGSASGFKKAAVQAILSGHVAESDPAIQEAVKQTLAAKPFLASARRQIGSWSGFCTQVEDLVDPSASMLETIFALWQAQDPQARESLRRILIRLRPQSESDYIQDVDVAGLSEHNLYGPLHTIQQGRAISQIICSHLPAEIVEPSQLITRIQQQGRQILREQIYFEAHNGTNAAMSFRTVIQALIHDGYVVAPTSRLEHSLIGYQRELTSETVRPYTNFRVIQDRRGNNLAVIKAKHFSAREFDRRCKEEGFVGISLSNRWVDGAFTPGLSLPLIMLIDVEDKTAINHRGVAKLIAMGWTVVVGYPALKRLIDRLAT